jgi:hypothetical protein
MQNQPTKQPSSTVMVDCTSFQLRAAWTEERRDGEVFECQCGPMSDAELAGIEHAAQHGQRIRLVSPESVVVLSHVRIARVGVTRWIVISGLVERAA